MQSLLIEYNPDSVPVEVEPILVPIVAKLDVVIRKLLSSYTFTVAPLGNEFKAM